jgi:hypothetical protein
MSDRKANAQLREEIRAKEDEILRLKIEIDNSVKEADRLIDPTKRSAWETLKESLRRFGEGCSGGYSPGGGARDALQRFRDKRGLEEEHIPQLERRLKKLEASVAKARDELYRRERPDLFQAQEPRETMTETTPNVSAGPDGQMIEIRKGDTLRKLAERHLGHESLWPEIYRIPENRNVIGGDPDKIYPGQRLILPEGAVALRPGASDSETTSGDAGQVDTRAMSALDLARHYAGASAPTPDPSAARDMEALRQASLELVRQSSDDIASQVADHVAGPGRWKEARRFAEQMAAQIAADAVYSARIEAEGPNAWDSGPPLDAARLASIESATIAATKAAERALADNYWNQCERETFQKVRAAAQQNALQAADSYHAPEAWTPPEGSLGEQALQTSMADLIADRFDYTGNAPIGISHGFEEEIGPGAPMEFEHFEIADPAPFGVSNVPPLWETASTRLPAAPELGQDPALKHFAQNLHSAASGLTQQRAYSAGLSEMRPQMDQALQNSFSQMHDAAYGAALPHFGANGPERR